MQTADLTRKKSELNVRFFYGNTVCCGTSSNLSVEGMHIHAKICYPIDSIFEVLFLFNKRVLKIPVKVRSLLKKNHFCNTMAVEIMSLHDDYMYLLDNLTPGDIQIKLPDKTREKVFA